MEFALTFFAAWLNNQKTEDMLYAGKRTRNDIEDDDDIGAPASLTVVSANAGGADGPFEFDAEDAIYGSRYKLVLEMFYGPSALTCRDFVHLFNISSESTVGKLLSAAALESPAMTVVTKLPPRLENNFNENNIGLLLGGPLKVEGENKFKQPRWNIASYPWGLDNTAITLFLQNPVQFYTDNQQFLQDPTSNTSIFDIEELTDKVSVRLWDCVQSVAVAHWLSNVADSAIRTHVMKLLQPDTGNGANYADNYMELLTKGRPKFIALQEGELLKCPSGYNQIFSEDQTDGASVLVRADIKCTQHDLKDFKNQILQEMPSGNDPFLDKKEAAKRNKSIKFVETFLRKLVAVKCTDDGYTVCGVHAKSGGENDAQRLAEILIHIQKSVETPTVFIGDWNIDKQKVYNAFSQTLIQRTGCVTEVALPDSFTSSKMRNLGITAQNGKVFVDTSAAKDFCIVIGPANSYSDSSVHLHPDLKPFSESNRGDHHPIVAKVTLNLATDPSSTLPVAKRRRTQNLFVKQVNQQAFEYAKIFNKA